MHMQNAIVNDYIYTCIIIVLSSYTSCNVSGWIEVAGATIMYSKVEQSCDDKAKLSLTFVVHQDFSGHAHQLTTTSSSLSSLPSTISTTWNV